MNIQEFIKFLQQLPPDTEVKVLKEVTRGYSTTTKWVPADSVDNVYYSDVSKTLYLGDA